MIRDDLSDRLIHLTKGATEKEAAERFLSIVGQKTLFGGTGLIRGGYKCVCFSEAPISKLGAILAEPSIHGMPYAPFGVMLAKTTRSLSEAGPSYTSPSLSSTCFMIRSVIGIRSTNPAKSRISVGNESGVCPWTVYAWTQLT